MDFVSRLLLREEIDALENDLSSARLAEGSDSPRVQYLQQQINKLEAAIAASRRATTGESSVGAAP